MTFSVAPLLVDALVETFTIALADVQVDVSDGALLSETDGDFLLVGVENPFDDSSTAVDTVSPWATYGTGPTTTGAVEERGDVTCVLYRLNGDSNQSRVRADAYAVMDLIAAALASNSAQDVPGVQWCRLGSTHRLTQAQTDYGAEAAIVFTVNFYAYH